MAVTSETEIMNSALIKLGAERIISQDDANTRARLCKERYPKVRDMVLRSHPWNFCTSYVELSVVDPKPSNVYEYDYVFQLPTDCLRVVGTDLTHADDWEEIEGRRIAANLSVLKAKIIKKITDVSKYDDNFCEVLAWALAKDIAYALTQSQARADGAEKSYKEELALARSFDAQVGSPKKVVADTWVDSRFY